MSGVFVLFRSDKEACLRLHLRHGTRGQQIITQLHQGISSETSKFTVEFTWEAISSRSLIKFQFSNGVFFFKCRNLLIQILFVFIRYFDQELSQVSFDIYR